MKEKGPEHFNAWTLISVRCALCSFAGENGKAYHLRKRCGALSQLYDVSDAVEGLDSILATLHGLQ
jgi:hypothetical protein